MVSPETSGCDRGCGITGSSDLDVSVKSKKKTRRKKTNPTRPPQIESLNFLHFNPRGFLNKEEVVKDFMSKKKIRFAGFAETHTYNNSLISDKKWEWQGGAESRPTLGNLAPPGGISVLAERGLVFSVVRSGKYSLWSRIEIEGGSLIFVAECYFPTARKPKSTNKRGMRSRLDVTSFGQLDTS